MIKKCHIKKKTMNIYLLNGTQQPKINGKTKNRPGSPKACSLISVHINHHAQVVTLGTKPTK